MATKIGTTKISNSYRGIRFEVKKGDIENGQPNDPCNCAAARALRRHAKAKEVFVYRNVTYIVKMDGSVLRFHTPPDLRLETIVFDRKGAFHPGEYDLQAMPLSAVSPPRKQAAADKTNSRKRNSRAGSSRPHRPIPNVRPTASQRLARA